MKLERIIEPLSEEGKVSTDKSYILINNLKKVNRSAYRNFKKLSRIYHRKKFFGNIKKEN